jgi:hypothetical protein
MSFDFLAAIKNIAPILAGTFGTPLLGMAVSSLCNELPAEQAASIQAAHAADPKGGALAKMGEMFSQGIINTAQIKAAEAKHAEKMMELGFKSTVDLEKIAAGDRASARSMASAAKFPMSEILSVVVVVAWCLIQWHLINNSIPADMREIITRVLGTLDAALMLVLTFNFGSTAQSHAQVATISEIAKAP